MGIRGLCHTLVAGLIVGNSLAANAQEQLELSFDAGQVTLVAKGVSLDRILDAWSVAGETRFVDADGLPRERLDLQLVDVPETDALRILLRGVKGYVAAPRADRPIGRSRFDQVILMTSSPNATRAARAPSQPRQPYPSASRRTPAPRPRRGPTGASENGGSRLSERDALNALRDLLPQPADATSPGNPATRVRRMSLGPWGTAQTTPRPGMVVDVPDDAAPVFARPQPVRPQRDDP
jgi:hypothetical protein